MKDPHRYDDIIDLPRHVSKNHRPMSNADRAAQFLPFAALTGYDDAIRETARLTENRIELSENELTELNDQFQRIAGQIRQQPEVTVTYFVEDEKKTGGRYETRTLQIRRIDPVRRVLIGKDRTVIAMDDIFEIHSVLKRNDGIE
ncbi:MAG: YolD-like family protein [Erysipelotrichaceae bacterium]|nr:YolD-like family protein [Erysipelotrichaceae bacterium]